MSLTEAQKQAIEDSNKFDWNSAQPINAGQGALTSNISTMPSLTGISLGFNTNLSGGTLPSGRSMGGLYSNFNPVVKKPTAKPNEAGSTDESSGTDAAVVKAKKKFSETKFGSRLKAAALATPLGQGIKGISGLVKKIKAKKAAKQTENKEKENGN